MKKIIILSCLAVFAVSPFAIADSRYTANSILSEPSKYEGKAVKLDVTSLRPVRFKSPVPELQFFRAMTFDRWDNKPGGAIIVAVDAAQADEFTKKYGVGRDGRSTTRLEGTLISGRNSKREGRRASVWIVDTTGKAAELLENLGDAAPEFGEDIPER